jgi:hypothetical protein
LAVFAPEPVSLDGLTPVTAMPKFLALLPAGATEACTSPLFMKASHSPSDGLGAPLSETSALLLEPCGLVFVSLAVSLDVVRPDGRARIDDKHRRDWPSLRKRRGPKDNTHVSNIKNANPRTCSRALGRPI